MAELLISSAVLITVLALLRLLLRGRIPSGIRYAMWLLVLLRLALPFSLFPSPVSAAGIVSQAIRVEETAGGDQAVWLDNAAQAPGSEMRPAGRPNAERMLLYGWPAGSVIAAIWFGVVNGKLAVRLRRTRRRFDYTAPVPIYIADGLSSPCLYGLFRPAVYLTEQAADDPRRAHITITHELTHLRHRDHIWSAARVLCLIVYWFDPFVWLAAWLSKQDGELYCDDCAIRALGEEQRFAYGRALLELSETAVRPSDLICGASTLSGGARRMRERITRIVNRPKRSLPLCILMAVFVLAAAAFTFSGSPEALAEPDNVPSVTPPPILAASAPDGERAAVIPTSVPEADEGESVVQTSAPARDILPTPVPTEAPYQNDTTAEEAPSGGGGTSQIQWVQTAETASPPDETTAPIYTMPPDEDFETTAPVYTMPPDEDFETSAPASTSVPIEQEETSAPIPTPPVNDAETIVVRDMRDVYMNSDTDPYPDMPSTMPDTPPPAVMATPEPG